MAHNYAPYIRKVWYYETDQMGIVHHSNYIRWFEEARVDFMEKIGYGYNKAVASGIDFAVLYVSCDYKSMARFGETVKITLDIPYVEAMRMALVYQVSDMATGEIRVVGESRHCYYDNLKKRPTMLKKELPELYEIFARIADGTKRC